jgi:hypothetical protein
MEFSEEFRGALFDEAVARGMLLSATVDLHGKPWCDETMDALEFAVGVYLKRDRQLHAASQDHQANIVRQLLAAA